MDTSMSEDEDHMCPICCGPMDKTDYRLFPCPCGFQICMWCLNTLEAEKDRCPNCRAPYNKENYRIVDEPKSLTTNEETTGNTHNKSIDVEKRNKMARMRQTRIIQRNLVYIVGMTSEDSDVTSLQSDSMFGKYGHIQKVVLGGTMSHSQTTTIGIYLTFENDDDALHCIEAVDGFCYKNHILKASFGTTKYCNSFIRGVECANPDCLYLHKEAPDRDCFLRDEMTIGDYSFYKATHPGHGSYWDRQQKLFLYYRKTSRRSGTELPNYHEMLNPSSVYFGSNPYEMDRLIPDKVRLFSGRITRKTDIYFTTDVDFLRKRKDRSRNIGVSIDLNDLFGTVPSEIERNGYVDERDSREVQYPYEKKKRDGYRRTRGPN